MGTKGSEASPHVTIANQLTVKLMLIGVCAAFVGLLAVIEGPSGPIVFLFLAAVNVVVLWLVVQAVFAALDDLLEAKLRTRE